MKQRFEKIAHWGRANWRWLYAWPLAVLFALTYLLATGFGRRCWCGDHVRRCRH